MKSKRLLVGNWKMYLGSSEATALASQLATFSKDLKHSAAWIAPSFPHLAGCAQAAKGSPVQVGAQNVCWEANGAFTGEVSLASLKECGCNFAIVGHSERRLLCGETPELVARRMNFALQSNLQVILCVGETFEQHQDGETHAALAEQLAPVVDGLAAEHADHLCVAYEPVWAIGTGRYPTNQEIRGAHEFIAQQFARKMKEPPCILYGGSVTPENFEHILGVPLVHGALVGRASLKFEQFRALIEISERCGPIL